MLSHAAGLSRSVYLETFGCQMNELDSELVRGHLGALGYQFVDNPENADVVLYNTCSVREQAEQKVWSRLGIIGAQRREGTAARASIVGVIGCMAEREGPDMMRRFPQIDLMCGPGELDKLPMLIDNALKTDAVDRADRLSQSLSQRVALQGNTNRRSATLSAASDNLEMLDLARAFDPDRAEAGGKSAYVRITRGCNKFCTYCVVPYTRGAEVHRPPEAIVDECRRLADAGVIEVTLLGQTVNHYCYVHGAAVSAHGLELPQIGGSAKANSRVATRSWVTAVVDAQIRPESRSDPAIGAQRCTSFADLLHCIHEEVPAIQRLRFLTSYPRDFGDDVLRVMRDSPRICRYLHAPAQSGSNRILKLMNRGYSVEEYLEFIDRARSFLPDVSIAGDIIVGFPSETDEDFDMTKDLLRRVRFKNNFIFKYSPRPGTAAIERFADDVPDEIKRRRNNELLALQAEIGAEVHRAYVGRVVDVFVERVSRRSSAKHAPAAPAHSAGTNGQRIELRWENASLKSQISDFKSQISDVQSEAATQRVQMSGRTPGDLIAVFDLPTHLDESALIGRVVPVRVTASGPLLLQGELVQTSMGEL